MLTKAREKKTFRRLVKTGFTVATTAGWTVKEKRTEAPMNPRTNFGKRLQMTLRLVPRLSADRALHHTDSRNAATPIRTFWENFTIVPTLVAVSPINSPAATTEP